MGAKEKTTAKEPHPTQVDRWPKVELRQNRRVPENFPMECHAQNQVIAGRAENISLGGVLMRTAQTLPWDEMVTLSFLFPGSTEAVQVKARVANVVVDVFMGLEFLELPPQVRARIEQFLSHNPDGSPQRS